MFLSSPAIIYAAIATAALVQAIPLNITDNASMKSAASTIAYGLMSYYTGNQSGNEPGLIPPPYYWWEAGGMWGGMIEYWYYTGGASYNDVITQALLAQASPTRDFLMPEEAGQTGNDDQVFWGLTAMTAAERAFPNPPATSPQWLELAANVFNDMVPRWNTSTCAGGLQWQFNPNNGGGFYQKTSIANGGFFQLAARLARYTGNATYSDWAGRTYDWMARIGLIGGDYSVFDGSDDTINCTAVDHDQWSYNAGAVLLGAAMMANISAASSTDVSWAVRTKGLLDAAKTAFVYPGTNVTNVLFEAKCEEALTCNVDQWSFKTYLARWMVETAQVQPGLAAEVMQVVDASAVGAAAGCIGPGNACGTKWYVNGFDGVTGLGQEMAALAVVGGLLVDFGAGPTVATLRRVR